VYAGGQLVRLGSTIIAAGIESIPQSIVLAGVESIAEYVDAYVLSPALAEGLAKNTHSIYEDVNWENVQAYQQDVFQEIYDNPDDQWSKDQIEAWKETGNDEWLDGYNEYVEYRQQQEDLEQKRQELLDQLDELQRREDLRQQQIEEQNRQDAHDKLDIFYQQNPNPTQEDIDAFTSMIFTRYGEGDWQQEFVSSVQTRFEVDQKIEGIMSSIYSTEEQAEQAEQVEEQAEQVEEEISFPEEREGDGDGADAAADDDETQAPGDDDVGGDDIAGGGGVGKDGRGETPSAFHPQLGARITPSTRFQYSVPTERGVGDRTQQGRLGTGQGRGGTVQKPTAEQELYSKMVEMAEQMIQDAVQ
jgi:hypothetical protein